MKQSGKRAGGSDAAGVSEPGGNRANREARRRSALFTYIQTFGVCLAMVALCIFVFWKKFTDPIAEGGMGVSPAAVWILAGILVVISGFACRRGYLNAVGRDEQ